ncbi:hypothetical protein M153_10004264 [Pseudoloma neurophilia]|uniref:Uncharacterized protein n=1 Tax=Pseudoloma neurophilia TaxID=146866 RepID=A0A0R0M7A5_9MICR|nr:hypothetical protein M153_10004264 [Pseudoloma neurophilia]
MLFFYLTIIFTAENPKVEQNSLYNQVNSSVKGLNVLLKEKGDLLEGFEKKMSRIESEIIQNGEISEHESNELEEINEQLDAFHESLKSMKATVHQMQEYMDILERENSASEEKSNSESKEE